MLRYTPKYWILTTTLLKKPMRQAYGKEFTAKVLKRGKAVYREMLAKVDDIGADNPMAPNVYLSFVLMALWKAADGAITPEALVGLVTDLLESSLGRKHMGGMDLNDPADRAKLEASLHASKRWADDHPEYRDATWDLNFDETRHRDGIYYHYTRCPIERFARENGFLEALPAGCALDYPIARARHAVLHREQTLATGGTMCDFWLVPDQVEDPR